MYYAAINWLFWWQYMTVLSHIEELGQIVNVDEYRRLEAVLDEAKSKDEIDRLILNHSIPQSAAAKACGISLNTFRDRVAEAKKLGVIPEILQTGNRYLYTLKHMHALMDWMEIPKWSDKQLGCNVMNIQNQKGGTGKSTTLISIAAGLALNLQQRMKVLVIDLDPQGSMRIYAESDPENSNDLLTAVDLMLGNKEEDSYYASLRDMGYEHDELVKMSVINTHIPNLSVLPAFPSDERFSAAAWNDYAKTGQLDYVNYLKEKVIKHLRDDYDLILIDTGPHVNPLVWSAMEACNSILVPVSPRKLDWKSTGQFLSELGGHISNLPSAGKQLNYFKIMVVNFDDEQNRDLEILDQIKDVSGKTVFSSVIKRSSAFEAANRHYRTVFDIRKSDGFCPDRQLEKAVDSLKNVVRELMLDLNDVKSAKE